MKQELTLSVTLAVLLLLLLNPFDLWMPSMLTYTLLVLLLVLFGFFAAFVWREASRDERETLHKLIAGRFAFLTGAGILVIAIITEEVRNSADIWLIVALGGMVLAKAGAVYHGKLRH